MECFWWCIWLRSKIISLNFKTLVFHNVHFDTSALVTGQFKDKRQDTCLEILLEICLHAAETEVGFLP